MRANIGDKMIFSNIFYDLTNYQLDIKELKGISIDSRKIEKGDIFIALKGENYDGHNFIDDCLVYGIKDEILQMKLGVLLKLNTKNNINETKPKSLENIFKKLKQFTSRLPDYRNPKIIFIVDTIPRNKNGKKLRDPEKLIDLTSSLNLSHGTSTS